MSKRHARVDVTSHGVRVVDMNSANGILVDAVPVTRLEVVGGEKLILGDTTLEIAVDSATSGVGRT